MYSKRVNKSEEGPRHQAPVPSGRWVGCGVVELAELEERILRSPLEAFQIGISPAVDGAARLGFLGLALRAAVVLFALLHLLGFFSIAFGDRRFSWSSDGSLLRAECALG